MELLEEKLSSLEAISKTLANEITTIKALLKSKREELRKEALKFEAMKEKATKQEEQKKEFKHLEGMDRIIRAKDIGVLFGISKATVYSWKKNKPNFPKEIVLGSTSKGYLLSEVKAFMNDLMNNGAE